MKSLRRWVTIVVGSLLTALVLALAFSAAPAQAFDNWVHDGASSCASCHANGTPDSTVCQSCHAGFQKLPSQTCWTCHAPGQDTSSLSSTSAACAQECHLWNQPSKSYSIPYSHGPSPHLGATGWGKTCLDCHGVSQSFGDPDGSPHHSGQTSEPPTCRACHNGVLASAQQTHDGVDCTGCHDGMNFPPVPATCNRCHQVKTFGTGDCRGCHASMIHNPQPNVGACTTCHSAYKQHAGKVACERCHTNEAAVHHVNVKIEAKSCAGCHRKTHAGHRIGRCTTCHKGTAPKGKPRVQHSGRISRRYVCGACHSKPLHARAYGALLTCRSCHGGKFHARQNTGTGVCLRCHTAARSHSVGFSCSVCHRRAIHNARPRA